MNSFIPINKMSKKKQKEYYSRQRKGWGGLSPVTRSPEDPKAYNRARSKRETLSDKGGY